MSRLNEREGDRVEGEVAAKVIGGKARVEVASQKRSDGRCSSAIEPDVLRGEAVADEGKANFGFRNRQFASNLSLLPGWNPSKRTRPGALTRQAEEKDSIAKTSSQALTQLQSPRVVGFRHPLSATIGKLTERVERKRRAAKKDGSLHLLCFAIFLFSPHSPLLLSPLRLSLQLPLTSSFHIVASMSSKTVSSRNPHSRCRFSPEILHSLSSLFESPDLTLMNIVASI